MRQGRPLQAGSYCYEGRHLATGWHFHDLHQLEYAAAGLVEVQDASGHYLLPPQQAAWIPAGRFHESTLHTAVRTVSVFFDPRLVPAPGERVRILAVLPLLREMIGHATRWPISRAESGAMADRFFLALADQVTEALEHEAPLRLPSCDDSVVAAAMSYTREHLQCVTAGDVARAVGASERTLRRHFKSRAGISWQAYLAQARILTAMALLAQPGTSILEASLAVGFTNPNSFTRAFASHCGETPRSYRRRISVESGRLGHPAPLRGRAAGRPAGHAGNAAGLDRVSDRQADGLDF